MMKFIAWMIAWVACFLMLVMPAVAGITPEYPLPITSISAGDQFARIPDWSQVTLRSLPPIQEDGQFAASAEVNSAAGYDLSRSWKAGQTADQYLKLGDLQTSFYPQIFNLYSIGQIAHLDVQFQGWGIIQLGKCLRLKLCSRKLVSHRVAVSGHFYRADLNWGSST
jgi:hypothetical protein